MVNGDGLGTKFTDHLSIGLFNKEEGYRSKIARTLDGKKAFNDALGTTTTGA